jgi:heme exporter protein A
LEAVDVSCRRGEELLFRDLSFEILPGQLVWLRGQNGSGKTSLLRIVAGLSPPDAGVVSLGAGRARVYIGHANALKDDLTVTESLTFLARLHGLDSEPEAVRAALRTLAIHHRRHATVRTLSQGQRRRVALARLALERAPSLWILDEPFDALDTEGVKAVNQLLVGHLGRQGSVLLTSHLQLDLQSTAVHELDLQSGTLS